MSEKKELNEQQLENTAGGGGPGMMYVKCPCGCNTTYTANAYQWPSNGTFLGVCSNGYRAEISDSLKARFTKEGCPTLSAEFNSNCR